MSTRDLPAPTDDELLKFFVDNLPSMAMHDFRHRNGMWDADLYRLGEHFRNEWYRRMYGRERTPYDT